LIERRPLGKVGVSCHASLSRRCRPEIEDDLMAQQRDAVLHRRRRRSTDNDSTAAAHMQRRCLHTSGVREGCLTVHAVGDFWYGFLV
jgi:hypothetical protein